MLRGSALPLPDCLAAHKSEIEATRLQYLAARARPPTMSVGALDSRLGGVPWWPYGEKYPKDVSGHPLYLLAQINLAQAKPVPGMPGHGLLQLFVMADPKFLYGANIQNPAEPVGFACRYHPDLTRPGGLYDGLPTPDAKHPLPLEDPLQPIGLDCTLSSMTVTTSDYRFEQLLPQIADNDHLSEAYHDWSSYELSPIRVGGYSTFMQDDPRQFPLPRALGDVTLMTIDTTNGVMWGDSGTAQFLMTEADLVERNFRRVAYNWDCG